MLASTIGIRLAKRLQTWSVTLLVAMALGVSPAQAVTPQARTARVELTVFNDLTRTPLPGALVRIPEERFAAWTDSLGVVLIQQDPGTYRITLTRAGFEDVEGFLTIDQSGRHGMTMVPELTTDESEAGQLIGRITTAESGAPLFGASISIPALETSRLSDRDGRFLLEELPAGPHQVEITFLGRATIQDSIFIRPGSTLEVAVPMPIAAIELEGLNVTVHSRFLTRMGFFRRRRQMGAYEGGQWTSRDLAESRAMSVIDVVQGLPGVRYSIPVGGGLPRFDHFRCPSFAIYIDNFLMEPWFDVENVDLSRIEAVEVFYGPSMPLRFQLNHCGVVLIWMRH